VVDSAARDLAASMCAAVQASPGGMQDVQEVFMAVRKMSWSADKEAPGSSTHREEAVRRMMAVRGVDLQELYDVDAVPEEQAERMSFDVMKNEWVSETVGVKVARRMFSSGSRYGCIRMRDTDHGRIKVLKVCFEDQTEERMWEIVKTQALAEICCAIFQSKCPSNVQASAFPPRFIYRLLQRDGQPAILVDELLAEGYNFEKRWLALHPSSQNPEDVMESHKWAVFQYCSYLQADKSMVFERCTSIDGKWVGPVIHSIDRSFGGSDDRGAPAIDRWVGDYSEKYAGLLEVRAQDLFTLTGEQMIEAMSRKGLLPARGTAPLSLLSSPLSSPNSDHSVGLSMASPVLSNGSAASGVCAANTSPTGFVSPYPGSPQSQVAVHVRSSSNSDHSDAVRLSIRSSGPNREASDPVPDEYPDDYAISPPMSEDGEDNSKHMARLASTLNQKFNMPSETPWLAPAMLQSLKTTHPIALDEAVVASTPVAVTINVNINVSAILKNASETPKKVVRKTASLPEIEPDLASRPTAHDHLTATPLPAHSSPPFTQAPSSTARDGESLHQIFDPSGVPCAGSDVNEDGCVPLSALRPRPAAATSKNLTLVTEGLQRFSRAGAPVGEREITGSEASGSHRLAASRSVSMARGVASSSRETASSSSMAPLLQASAVGVAGYGAPVENYEAEQLHQLTQRRLVCPLDFVNRFLGCCKSPALVCVCVYSRMRARAGSCAMS
jgi:hypothetical protein